MDGVAHIVVDKVLAEDFLLVHLQRRREVRVALVEFQRKIQKFFLLFFGQYLFDSDHVLTMFGMEANADGVRPAVASDGWIDRNGDDI